MSRYRKLVPGKGADHHGKKRIVVAFDEDTFSEVRAVAVKQKISFGEAVRQLVEFGLIDMGQIS